MYPSTNGPPLGEEELEDLREVSREFFAAVSDGDGRRLWELLSEDARAYVLNIAIEGGMDFDRGSRLRQGTASEEEWDEYLTALVGGIQRDLRGVDLERLTFELRREPEVPSVIRVHYLVEVGSGDGSGHRIPAGSLRMVREGGAWRVLRLVPKPG